METTVRQLDSVFTANLVSVAGGLVAVVGAKVIVFNCVVEVIWHSGYVGLLQVVELRNKSKILLVFRLIKLFFIHFG